MTRLKTDLNVINAQQKHYILAEHTIVAVFIELLLKYAEKYIGCPHYKHQIISL